MDKQPEMMNRKDYDLWLRELHPHVCTFCDPTKQIVIKEFDYWIWIANIAPYWKYHTMIVPKRHFEKFSDMTFLEAGELIKVIDYGEKKMIDAKLKRDDGTLIEKVVYFWRFRLDRFDPLSGTVRPSHFHCHLCFDKDRLWDPIIDENAKDWDPDVFR